MAGGSSGARPLLDTTGDPYQYAGNQPLLYTDPTGLLSCGPFADVCHKTAGLAGDVTDSITHNSLTPGANPLADKLNSVLNTRVGSMGSKTLAVFGNGISFGGIEHLDAKLSPGSECYYANLGAAYQIIELAGNLVGAELTGAGLTRLADLALTRGAAALQRLGPINDTGAIRFGGKAAETIGDDALVARGGSEQALSPEGLAERFGTHPAGVSGWSAQSRDGLCLQDLCAFIPNGKVGVTTAGTIRRAGGDVVITPGRGFHVTVTGISPEDLSMLLRIERNPLR